MYMSKMYKTVGLILCDARSTILGHRAPLIHTWPPRPCFLLFPKFRSPLSLSLSLSLLGLDYHPGSVPSCFPPLCILNNYSSLFCQVSDVYPEPFEYSITLILVSEVGSLDRLPSIEDHIKKGKKNRLPSILDCFKNLQTDAQDTK